MQNIVEGTVGHVLTNDNQVGRCIATTDYWQDIGMGKYSVQKVKAETAIFQNLVFSMEKASESQFAFFMFWQNKKNVKFSP